MSQKSIGGRRIRNALLNEYSSRYKHCIQRVTKPKSSVGELLMDIEDNFNFFAPDLLIAELERYEKKIQQYSKLSDKELDNIKSLILSSITFVSEELISEDNWKDAYVIAKDIDEDDTPFLALGLELKAKLWTGDKVLTRGLNKKQVDLIITTKELQSNHK